MNLKTPIDARSAHAGDGYLLRSEADLADVASRALQKAKALGAPEAIASVSESGGIDIRVAKGEVQTATRDGTQALQITVFEGGRTGSAATQAFNPEAIERAVEQAVAIARQLEADPDAALPDPDTLAWDTPDVPLFSPANLTPADLTAAALEQEAGLQDASHRDLVRGIETAATARDSRWALATSQGFCRTGSASMQRRWAAAIAERDNEMVRAGWFAMDRRIEALAPNYGIGKRAAELAREKLGATTLTTRRVSVLFDATVAGELVSSLCDALTGSSQFRRMTFLPDGLGKKATADHVTVQEDPFEPYGLASAAFDIEGVAGTRREIVRDGVVAGLFLDTKMARKLGMRSTGNAGGMRNLTFVSRLTKGTDDTPAMLGKMGEGLWLTEFFGGGVNPVTGAFSKAATGFWVEKGVVVGPVNNFTVAGNLLEMMQGVEAVGADIHREGGLRTGSILIRNLQIAGR